MADPTEEFFNGLGRRGHISLLEKVKGTVRFDLAEDRETEHWFLSITEGDLGVSHEEREADCVLRTDHGLFDRVARGEENAMAALLRGAITFEGNLQLFILFERLLPGPPVAHDPRTMPVVEGGSR